VYDLDQNRDVMVSIMIYARAHTHIYNYIYIFTYTYYIPTMWVVQKLGTPPDGDLNGKKDDKASDAGVPYLNGKII
jgi:hypothetical protein